MEGIRNMICWSGSPLATMTARTSTLSTSTLNRCLPAMRSSILVTMVGLLAFLASCASLDPGVAMLDKYPGVKQQIMSYYNTNATEESWGCNAVYMDNITEAKIIRETPQQLIL